MGDIAEVRGKVAETLRAKPVMGQQLQNTGAEPCEDTVFSRLCAAYLFHFLVLLVIFNFSPSPVEMHVVLCVLSKPAAWVRASNWLAEVGSAPLTGAPCNYTLTLSLGLSPAC